MRAAVLVVVAIAARSAAADDGLAVRVKREAAPDPLLTIDPMLQSHFEGLAQQTERHVTEVSIGDTTVILEGIATANVDRPEGVAEDLASNGWHAAVRFSKHLGLVDVEGWASLNGAENRYGHGVYRDVGVALVRRFKLSRWMTAWISLSIGARTWLGAQPPPGEANGIQAMLSVGTTFR